MTPFTSVLDVLGKVLEALTSPEASGGCPLNPAPCRVALYPGGQVAFDSCSPSSCSDGEGQLWANLQSSTVTNPDSSGCQVIRFTAEIGITRCEAGMDSKGNPPSVDAVTADAWKQAIDADTIQQVITCCDYLSLDDRDKLSLSSWRPIDPQGGCIGGIWTVTGVLNVCC